MTIHSIVIQKLLNTNAHLGHRLATPHFNLYTYGHRNGFTVIDPEKTLICLRNACHFIGALARRNGRFLFVNTNPKYDAIVEQMTKKIGCYNRSASVIWRKCGFLTNSSSPKTFRSRKKKMVFAPSQPPDCVVIMDSDRRSSVIFEADLMHIPVVSLIDPTTPLDIYRRVAYPVPANDSMEFVYLFCNMITKTILLEKKLAAAEKEEELDDEDSVLKDSEQVTVVPYQSLEPLPEDMAETRELLDKLAVVNFDEISGSDMLFNGPKSAIEVCDGLTFLDLIVDQIKSLNSKYECSVPLLLMNTIQTDEDAQMVLEKYSKSNIDIRTVSQSQDSEQEFVGEPSNKDELYSSDYHGVFLSLMNSGALYELLSQGKEYILVVSSDNAASMVDPKILNHLSQNKIDACMEVTSKGLIDLSDSTEDQHQENFKFAEIARDRSQLDMEKFKFIETRSLWANLKAVKKLVDTDAINPENHSVPEEANETAPGSIIRFFDDAIGVDVSESRFVPMDRTSDLLILQSDLYTSVEGVLVRNPARTNPENPSIQLGPEFEKVSDFQSRFKSIPSLIELDSLEVLGDVWFGADIVLKGNVSIIAEPGEMLEIPDGVVLENKQISGPEDIREEDPFMHFGS